MSNWFRLVVLIAFFVLVIMTMQTLSEKGLSPTTAEMLGAPVQHVPELTVKEMVQKEKELKQNLTALCDPQSMLIERPAAYRLSRSNGKWRQIAPRQKPLEALDMDVWMNDFCSLDSQILKVAAEGGEFHAVLTFIQADNQKFDLEKSETGVFRFREKAFTSEDIQKALFALDTIVHKQKDETSRH